MSLIPVNETLRLDSRRVWRQLGWVSVFAVAMGLLEAICVIYLRRLILSIEVGHSLVPVARFPIELIREACTIAMLVAVAWMAGFNARSRSAYFFFAFGVWDILYYVGLKWLAGWPSSWLEWDCLFLIPTRWYGPVLAPILISLYMMFACCVLLANEQRGTPLRMWVAIPTQSLALATWYWSFVRNTGRIWIATRGYAGVRYSWPLFAVGLLLGLTGLWLAIRTRRAAVPKTYNPRSFDHMAEEYDFVATRERSPAFFLNNLPERRQRVLDVGCGTGILADELSRHFGSVVAIDISEPMLAIARARRFAPNIDYRREDANHLALDQTFDCIISHSTFHHLEDISATLRTLKASLEPRGRLILIDNASRCPLIPRNACTSTAKACLKFAPNLFRYGLRFAWRSFRFYTSRYWLDHIKADNILSRARFREIYAAALPGATFVPLKYFMGVIWQAPGGDV
jgi:ubiquinone/menaquinone biosynthesis C-methylase UbiE